MEPRNGVGVGGKIEKVVKRSSTIVPTVSDLGEAAAPEMMMLH